MLGVGTGASRPGKRLRRRALLSREEKPALAKHLPCTRPLTGCFPVCHCITTTLITGETGRASSAGLSKATELPGVPCPSLPQLTPGAGPGKVTGQSTALSLSWPRVLPTCWQFHVSTCDYELRLPCAGSRTPVLTAVSWAPLGEGLPFPPPRPPPLPSLRVPRLREWLEINMAAGKLAALPDLHVKN